MITVSEVVAEIIKSSYFLEEGLSSKIINLSSLARKIRPEIEGRTYKRVSIGAIVMALKRLSKKIRLTHDKMNIFKNKPDMIVRSNLVEFTIINSSTLFKKEKKLLELIEKQPNAFLTITQGIFETAVITNQENIKTVEQNLKDEKIDHVLNNLSSITIKLPEENVMVPGVYFYILKALAWENINIIDVVSTYSEFTIVLEDKSIDKAFSCLKKALT